MPVDVIKLYWQHYGWMYACAFKFLRDHQRAEDAVQESFLRFSRISVPSGGSEAAWLAGIKRRVILEMLRKCTEKPLPTSEDGTIIDVSSDAESPDEIVSKEEVERDLKQCIETLSIEERDTVFSKYWPIGVKSPISSTERMRRRRALEKLRKCMKLKGH